MIVWRCPRCGAIGGHLADCPKDLPGLPESVNIAEALTPEPNPTHGPQKNVLPPKPTSPAIIVHFRKEGGEPIGQWPIDEARRLIRSGEIGMADYYWHEGLDQWKPVSQSQIAHQASFASAQTQNPPDYSRSAQYTPSLSRSIGSYTLLLAIISIAVIGFFRFMHIVRYSNGILVIPKEHFSFLMTFTSLDEILRRHNSMVDDSMPHDSLLQHLIQELRNRQMITKNPGQAQQRETSIRH
jgi:hypothetical protein